MITTVSLVIVYVLYPKVACWIETEVCFPKCKWVLLFLLFSHLETLIFPTPLIFIAHASTAFIREL